MKGVIITILSVGIFYGLYQLLLWLSNKVMWTSLFQNLSKSSIVGAILIFIIFSLVTAIPFYVSVGISGLDKPYTSIILCVLVVAYYLYTIVQIAMSNTFSWVMLAIYIPYIGMVIWGIFTIIAVATEKRAERFV